MSAPCHSDGLVTAELLVPSLVVALLVVAPAVLLRRPSTWGSDGIIRNDSLEPAPSLGASLDVLSLRLVTVATCCAYTSQAELPGGPVSKALRHAH